MRAGACLPVRACVRACVRVRVSACVRACVFVCMCVCVCVCVQERYDFSFGPADVGLQPRAERDQQLDTLSPADTAGIITI